MPLDDFIKAVDAHLEPRSFRPLDLRDGQHGGERHGTWDWTWIASRLGLGSCLVSVLAERDSDNTYSVGVHAGASRNGAYGQVLIDLFVASEFEPARSTWWEVGMDAVRAAADRAVAFPDALLTAYRPIPVHRPGEPATDDFAEAIAAYLSAPAEFPPWPELLGPVEEVFLERPGHALTNREVLTALIRRGVRADRSGVNAALSELAHLGRLRRVRKGLYTREEVLRD